MRRSLVAVVLSLSLPLACHDATRVLRPDMDPDQPAFTIAGGGPAFAYVVARGGTVAVIDVTTNTIVTTISLGASIDGPQIVMSPDGTQAWVLHGGTTSNTVSVIDVATNTIATSITVPLNPVDGAFAPDGTQVWVSNSAGLSVIDASTFSVLATISVGSHPNGVAVTPDGTRVYVSSAVDHVVTVVDVATQTVISSISTGAGGPSPHDIVITPDGSRALVGNFLANEIAVIDLVTETVIANIPVGVNFADPRGIAITPDGTRAWAALHNSDAVAVIDLTTYAVIANIAMGRNPIHVAFTPDGTVAWVPVTGDNVIKAVDASTFAVLATLPGGVRPNGIGITPDGDNEGPTASDVAADINPVEVNGAVTVTASIDDTDSGGSDIAAAEYSLDGASGPWTPMTAADGSFDDPVENVEATVTAAAVAGVHELCVRGTDARGNTGDGECILFVVYDPDGGFVTGGGWFNSPPGAYLPDPGLTGKAHFGFVSRYKKGASIPTGNTEFQFKAGDLNFHGTSFDWLVVNQGGTNAQFKGSGTINGETAPGGSDYRFMLWAGDDDPDTFRMRIWWEDGGNDVDVYDNLFGTILGGGSIVIHAK